MVEGSDWGQLCAYSSQAVGASTQSAPGARFCAGQDEPAAIAPSREGMLVPSAASGGGARDAVANGAAYGGAVLARS